MYYTQPNMWYYPYPPNREDMMMSKDNQQMMEMMQEHMRMTEEIRQMVYDMNERFKWIEIELPTT
ncbi:hypothetical protein [Lentibacillus juripiscarius]|uniref:Spore coat protein n=1 Tax=Lentibacillus juripiscarius TaxID=257446 RepID=A0ABW5V6Y8_9BACI